MKKILSFIFITIFSVTMFSSSVFAKDIRLKFTSDTSGKGNTIKVKKIEQDDKNKNKLEVDLKTRVKWKKGSKITSVKDNKGVKYKAKLRDKDSDDFDMYISKLKYGRTYKITIKGVKKRGEKNYKNMVIKVKVPKKSAIKVLNVEEVDFDREDAELEFNFNTNTKRTSKPYIIVKDSNGKSYSSKSSDLYFDDSDECTLYLDKNLKQGKKYSYKIYGVKARNASLYSTISGAFRAYDD